MTTEIINGVEYYSQYKEANECEGCIADGVDAAKYSLCEALSSNKCNSVIWLKKERAPEQAPKPNDLWKLYSDLGRAWSFAGGDTKALEYMTVPEFLESCVRNGVKIKFN